MSAPAVRAKFRCLNVKLGWDGEHMAHLGPVTAKGDTLEYEDGLDGVKRQKIPHPENLMFWGATPSGEANVAFGMRTRYRHVEDPTGGTRGHSEKYKEPYPFTFENGAFYYIDFRPVVEGEEAQGEEWRIGSIELYLGSTFTITFYRREGNGTLKMGIENRGAIPIFLDPFMVKFEEQLQRKAVESPDWQQPKYTEECWWISFVKADR